MVCALVASASLCLASRFSPGLKSQALTLTPYPAFSSSAAIHSAHSRSSSAWLMKKSGTRPPSIAALACRPGYAVQQAVAGLGFVDIYQVDACRGVEQRVGVTAG